MRIVKERARRILERTIVYNAIGSAAKHNNGVICRNCLLVKGSRQVIRNPIGAQTGCLQNHKRCAASDCRKVCGSLSTQLRNLNRWLGSGGCILCRPSTRCNIIGTTNCKKESCCRVASHNPLVIRTHWSQNCSCHGCIQSIKVGLIYPCRAIGRLLHTTHASGLIDANGDKDAILGAIILPSHTATNRHIRTCSIACCKIIGRVCNGVIVRRIILSNRN